MRVAVSGYFNPLHKGHIRYLKEAKNLRHDRDIELIVIVNNDKQVELKGSFPFMDELERIEIISAIKYVDKVLLSIDEDETVCKSLEIIKPDYFAKGGDRTLDNIPEKKVCDRLGIKIITGIGGEKIQSSSELIKRIGG